MVDPTPLFSWPPADRGFDWLQILPILAAIPAAAILLVGIVRGRLVPAVAIVGVVFLPVAAYALGMLLHHGGLEDGELLRVLPRHGADRREPPRRKMIPVGDALPVKREMGRTGICHVAAHPDEALNGPAS